jgi:ribosomal protein S18 acetylase RimI-like enzyme
MVTVKRVTNDNKQLFEEIGKHYSQEFITYVLKTWQQQDELYVAQIDGKTVGFCGLVFPAPTEAQILGVRLYPDFQREDIGRRFVIALIQVAQERGCNIVRMLTSTENYETQAALQRNLNFDRRGTWVVSYREKVDPAVCRVKAIEPAPPEMLEEIWQYLQYSLTYKHSEGLIFNYGYSHRNFSKAYLNQLLEQGQVFVSQTGGIIAGLVVAHCQDDNMVLRYVDARPPAVEELLLGVLASHCQCNCQWLTAAIPLGCYRDIKLLLGQLVQNHRPDNWLVMEKEVSPLALPRD